MSSDAKHPSAVQLKGYRRFVLRLTARSFAERRIKIHALILRCPSAKNAVGQTLVPDTMNAVKA